MKQHEKNTALKGELGKSNLKGLIYVVAFYAIVHLLANAL